MWFFWEQLFEWHYLMCLLLLMFRVVSPSFDRSYIYWYLIYLQSIKCVETVVDIFIFLRAELVESLDLKLRLCRWIILVMKTWSAYKLSSVTHLLLDPIRYRLRWEAKSNRQLRSLYYLHLKSFKYLRSTFWTRVITREVD